MHAQRSKGRPNPNVRGIDAFFSNPAAVVPPNPPVLPAVVNPQVPAVQQAEAPPVSVPEWQQEAHQQALMDTGVGITDETPEATGKKGQNRHSGLLKECMSNINPDYQKTAIKKVREGELWDFPKTVRHRQLRGYGRVLEPMCERVVAMVFMANMQNTLHCTTRSGTRHKHVKMW